MFRSRPALTALIRGLIMTAGTTRRSRMPMRVRRLMRTPAAKAAIHRPTGMKLNRMRRADKPSTTMTMKRINSAKPSRPFHGAHHDAVAGDFHHHHGRPLGHHGPVGHHVIPLAIDQSDAR